MNLYANSILQNARLDESQAEIKIARQGIKTSTLQMIPLSKEELKSLLMRLKEENEKADLKFNIQKSKIMALVPLLHGKSKEKN